MSGTGLTRDDLTRLSVLSYGSSTTEDAIYLTGKWLVRSGGSAEDVGVCTSILSVSRPLSMWNSELIIN